MYFIKDSFQGLLSSHLNKRIAVRIHPWSNRGLNFEVVACGGCAADYVSITLAIVGRIDQQFVPFLNMTLC
jgi:hypothetical protein